MNARRPTLTRAGAAARAVLLAGVLTATTLSSGCDEVPLREVQGPQPDQYADVLDLAGVPADADDLSVFAFSDLGAWHMFGLPGHDPRGLGGFTGPLLLTDGGQWLSSSLVRLDLGVGGERVVWAPLPPAAVASFPGFLRQALVGETVDGQPISVLVELLFLSERSALIEVSVGNRSSDSLDVAVGWEGDSLFLAATLTAEEDGLSVVLDESGTVVDVGFSPGPFRMDRPGGNLSYRAEGDVTPLGPGETVVSRAVVSAYFSEQERAADAGRLDRLTSSPGAARAAHDARWRSYLAGALGAEPVGADDPRSRLAVKAVQTLVSNWRSPAGHLYHDGLFPSYAYRGFHGVWSWDSWKHARALALFAPDLARNQVRVMLDHQNERGMIPDVIYRDSSENNWRDTKPPLAAWAVQGIYESTRDTAFVAEVFPALLDYHRWWYTDRDHDGDGLCEYGSTDGTLIAAAWESGMDNAVRFDGTAMVQNGPEAWSMDQESVDLNAYLYAEKLFLADLASVLGQGAVADGLRSEAVGLGAAIREGMYDEADGYFYDIDIFDGETVRVQGPEGWIPLWAGVADSAQAGRVAEAMMDPERFAGRVPLPTLSMSRPEFDPMDGYWRGPVWLDQAYFGIAGLRRYGLHVAADRIEEDLLAGPVGLLDGAPIWENYHPVTGAGLNAPHFSWSAAHLLLLLRSSNP